MRPELHHPWLTDVATFFPNVDLVHIHLHLVDGCELLSNRRDHMPRNAGPELIDGCFGQFRSIDGETETADDNQQGVARNHLLTRRK